MRRLFLFIAFCLTLSSNISAQGVSESTWTAWVYNTSGQAWLITSNGIVLRTQRLIRQAYGDDLPAINVSNSGRYIAYGSQPFTVIDTQTGRPTVSFEPENTYTGMILAWAQQPFSADDTTVALGVGNSDYQTMTGVWEVFVFDTQTGQVLHQLHSSDLSVRAVEAPDFNHMPIIMNVTETEITFILFPDGMESGPLYGGYTWNVQTDEVTAQNVYTLRDDSLPNGERIHLQEDRRFEVYPCEGECGQFIHQNTIRLAKPSTNEFYPFFSTTALNLSYVYFIQNGERILARGRPFDEGASLLVVERDGTLVSRFSIPEMASIRGVTDGFVYTTTGANQLMQVNTREGATTGTPVWTAPQDGNLFVLWASDPVGTFSYTPWKEVFPPE